MPSGWHYVFEGDVEVHSLTTWFYHTPNTVLAIIFRMVGSKIHGRHIYCILPVFFVSEILLSVCSPLILPCFAVKRL
jgi:hypothetical protein